MSHEGIRGVDAGWLERLLVDLGYEFDSAAQEPKPCAFCRGTGRLVEEVGPNRQVARVACGNCNGTGALR